MTARATHAQSRRARRQHRIFSTTTSVEPPSSLQSSSAGARQTAGTRWRYPTTVEHWPPGAAGRQSARKVSPTNEAPAAARYDHCGNGAPPADPCPPPLPANGLGPLISVEQGSTPCPFGTLARAQAFTRCATSIPATDVATPKGLKGLEGLTSL